MERLVGGFSRLNERERSLVRLCLVLLALGLISFLLLHSNPLPVVHTIARGDTVFSISRRYGVSHQELIAANPVLNPLRIQVGQRLIIPDQPLIVWRGRHADGAARLVGFDNPPFYRLARKVSAKPQPAPKGQKQPSQTGR